MHYLDVGQANGQLYFVSEYVPGTDAAQVLKKTGPLPLRTAVSMVSQLLKGLEYAHDMGLVHRNIKPANMLLQQHDQGGEVKLADFGLARVYQASHLSGLSLTGATAGSAAFMPPEQITHYREANPPADQYSAAATLYNLLTGKYVYDVSDAVAQQFAKILHDKPVPIRKRRQDIPEALADVIHKALERKPKDRFADVKEFRKALLQVVALEL